MPGVFLRLLLGLLVAVSSFGLASCASERPERTHGDLAPLTFGAEQRAGQPSANAHSPFLRVAPNGHLYMTWAARDSRAPVNRTPTAAPAGHAHHHHHGQTASPTPGRVATGTAQRTAVKAPPVLTAAFLATSTDGAQTWSEPVRINDRLEVVQGDENLPKVAFGRDGKVYAVWSIPNEKGDRMRANIRFAVSDAGGPFGPAVTLNDVPDAARFPALEVAADGTTHVVWIDRRVDGPAPRALYSTRFSADGATIAANQRIGGPSCECCRVTMAFAEGGQRVFIAYRHKTEDQVRDIAVQTSSDGGASFGPPVIISDDGWQLKGCPHAGPVIATDAHGNLHVTWFTLGHKPEDAGIYYTVSRDGGKTFAPRKLVHAAGGPGVLHPYLAVGEGGEVYFAWDNVGANSDQTQVYFRYLAADGHTMSQVQQLSQASSNALRPNLTLARDRVYVAWTETKEDTSWIVVKTARIAP